MVFIKTNIRIFEGRQRDALGSSVHFGPEQGVTATARLAKNPAPTLLVSFGPLEGLEFQPAFLAPASLP